MFKGKALYQPQGRSGEYAKWAINFYNGCTGGCEYCYNKRFPLLSNIKPTLKVCFKDKTDAFEIAKKEIAAHKKDIVKDGGLFLSFVSDPFLADTAMLTYAVISYCSGLMQSSLAKRDKSIGSEAIPLIILTKQADMVLHDDPCFNDVDDALANSPFAKDIAFGFTLTGHDEMESGCSSNIDRIRAMKVLHNKGYRTWASIEPIIDLDSSLEMIRLAAPFCDHFKIGIRTDRKFVYDEAALERFINGVRIQADKSGSTFYFKRSFRDLVGGQDIEGKNFVKDSWNIFKQEN